MRYVPSAHAAAMQIAGGKFRDAAASLARRMDIDDELRAEASTLLIALLLEPARSAHAGAFEMDTGGSVDDFVARHTPDETEVRA